MDLIPITLQIADDFCSVLRTISGVRSAVYDEPMDLTVAVEQLPRAFVWDFDDQFDFMEMSGQYEQNTTFGVALLYSYTTRSETARRRGRLWQAKLTSTLLDDPTRNGLAFICTPSAAVVQPLAEPGDRGILWMEWSVRYFVRASNPYTQQVA